MDCLFDGLIMRTAARWINGLSTDWLVFRMMMLLRVVMMVNLVITIMIMVTGVYVHYVVKDTSKYRANRIVFESDSDDDNEAFSALVQSVQDVQLDKQVELLIARFLSLYFRG